MNTYKIDVFPEGWSNTAPTLSYTVQATQLTTTEDYIVFLDASNPPQATFLVPFSVNPVVTRTAVAS